MKVSCPHCGISGNVDEEKLRASSGRLRCPGCKEHFTVPLSEQDSDFSDFSTPRDEDILVTDDIHAAHADAMEAAISETIHSVLKDEPPNDAPGTDTGGAKPKRRSIFAKSPSPEPTVDDVDELLGDPDVQDMLDIPDDLGYIDDALDEFGVPERTGDADSGPGMPDIHGGGDLLDDEPLTLEEVLEDNAGGGEKRPSIWRRKFFSLPSLPTGDRLVRRPSPTRTLVSLALLTIILAAAVYVGVTRFSLPFRAEKLFGEDSRAMYEEYRRLDVYRDLGVSDEYYIVTVAETAYRLIRYREEYDADRAADPLYAAVTITGDLYLATDSFIDRMDQPDIYAGSEWGEGLPIASRDVYMTSLLEEMSRCFYQIDANMVFLHDRFDALDHVTLFSFLMDRQTLLDHTAEAKELASLHKDFISIPSELSFFSDIIADIEKELSGLR
jgi:predicted Zn finger-like uncharacterized protein